MLLSEMFGVERDTDFGVKGYESLFKVTLNTWGEEHLMFKLPCVSAWELVPHGMLCSVIFAAPSGIIHLPPPLTDEQREQLRALYTLGFKFLVKNNDGGAYAYRSKPNKTPYGWYVGEKLKAQVVSWLSVYSLVSWSDHEPYDIGKALGVERC
ncbi:MAG: hypothetical protein EOM62_21625 [Bacteroidia bacterium]|nr:hypothetical protein [Bacteroidia bacterium]